MIEKNKLREVLRLLLLPKDLSHTKIGKLANCPRQTVDDIHNKLRASEIQTATFAKMDDDELQRQIYPSMSARRRLKVEPDFTEIISECIRAHKKRRKTIWTKFCEYKQKYGDRGYGRSRFYQLVADFIKGTRLSMLQMFAPGEVMFIDYAGSTLSYCEDGKEIITYAFVATLGYSKKRFAYATKNMSAQSWIEACIAAIDFFGGVPEVIHCDNARAMVKKAGLLAELSHSANEFSKHYGVLIDTSQVATPTHNPLAENRVKELTHSVFACMNTDLTFFSLEEINQHLNTEVEKRNDKQMQRIGLSANDLFYSDESYQLQPKPNKPFEQTLFRSFVKVPENYFVWYDHNRYSVPHEYRNEYVEIRVVGKQLRILHKGILRVTHDIVPGKNNVVTINAHLHPNHLAQKNKTKSHYMEWAKSVDSLVEQVVERMYSKTKHDHSRPVGKRCQALQKLQHRFGDVAFIAACNHALKHDMLTVTEIELILKSKVYDVEPEVNETTHTNLRGQSYYAGGQYE